MDNFWRIGLCPGACDAAVRLYLYLVRKVAHSGINSAMTVRTGTRCGIVCSCLNTLCWWNHTRTMKLHTLQYSSIGVGSVASLTWSTSDLLPLDWRVELPTLLQPSVLIPLTPSQGNPWDPNACVSPMPPSVWGYTGNSTNSITTNNIPTKIYCTTIRKRKPVHIWCLSWPPDVLTFFYSQLTTIEINFTAWIMGS